MHSYFLQGVGVLLNRNDDDGDDDYDDVCNIPIAIVAASAAALYLLFSACVRGSDVVFAIDSSGSIGKHNVHEMTGFLELFMNSMNVDAKDFDPTVTRVGLLTYSDSAIVQFHLNTFHRRTGILQAINVRYLGGTTNAADAIRYSSWPSRFRSIFIAIVKYGQVLTPC